MCNSWPVCYDGLLDCGDPIASLAEADYRNTPHPTLFTRFLVHGAGAVNACWGWSRRGPRQSRGARGRSHSNRSAEIAGSAQPGVAAPESGASFKEGNLLAPLPPSCNPVSSLHSTRIEPSGMFGNTHSGLFCQSLRACIAPAQTLYRTQELGARYTCGNAHMAGRSPGTEDPHSPKMLGIQRVLCEVFLYVTEAKNAETIAAMATARPRIGWSAVRSVNTHSVWFFLVADESIDCMHKHRSLPVARQL